MCFGCAHRMALENGEIPKDTTYEEYMEKHFWIKLPEGKTFQDILDEFIESKNKWEVYMVECSDGTIYTGISNDVPKRVLTHNSGKGAKYTKTRLPVVLKWQKQCENRSEASKEEYKVKKLTKKQKLKLIEEYER